MAKVVMKTETEEKPLHVIELVASNVLRLKAVEIHPEGNAVTIEGENASGKSSILKTIAMLFGGEKLCPERPIREGETEAEAAADTGEFRVTRHWTANDKSVLKIVHKDGHAIGRPQEFLDKLVGRLSWNPIAFLSMKPEDRLKALREACGIDTTHEDAEYKVNYETRRDVNRDLDKVTKELATLAGIPATIETRTVTEIRKEYDKAVAHNGEIDGAEGKLTALRADYVRYQKEIKDREKMLTEIKAEADELAKTKDRPKKDVKALRAEMEAAESAAETRGKIERKAAAIKEQTMYRKTVEGIEKTMAETVESKAAKIRAANLPAGLGLGETDVTLNDIPFAQASRAEALKASIGVAMSMSPRFRVLLIEDGSLCDSATMAEIKKAAKKYDYQIWIEIARDKASGAENAVWVEDGEVAE